MSRKERWYVAIISEDADGPSDRQLALITGLGEKTIRCGEAELQDQLSALPVGRQRQEGGGRMRVKKHAVRAETVGTG